jgi:cytoskeletal protein RodZ
MPNERNLSDELIKQNQDFSAASPDVEQIVRRQRRYVRYWAIATALLWIIAVAYLLGLLSFYAVFIHPIIHEYFTTPDVDVNAVKPPLAVALVLLKAVLWWPALLLAAAACTTAFTLASRRATLRQIHASLTEISSQLKELSRGR